MSTATLELGALAEQLDLRSHLPECAARTADWRECHWCLGAVGITPVTDLLDCRHDAVALVEHSARSVAWVVAAAEVLRRSEIAGCITDPPRGAVPASVRSLVDRLGTAVRPDLGRLAGQLAAMTAAGSELERRCDATAGAMAAAAAGRPEHREALRSVDPVVRARLAELGDTLSEHLQVAGLLPWAERLHWQGLPELRTQPEWRRRGRVAERTPADSTGVVGEHLEPGTLEALVVEAVIDDVTEDLRRLGPRLAHAAAPVVLVRRDGDAVLSARTRGLVWRIARVDWVLTLCETGLMASWPPVEVDGCTGIRVPWHVAASIDACESLGLVSATREGHPQRRPAAM